MTGRVASILATAFFSGVLFSSCGDSATGPGEDDADPQALPAGTLVAGWISRTPALNYVESSTNPSVDGWPASGSDVTWYAHVRNWSTNDVRVPYRWLIDGLVVGQGAITIRANAIDSVPFRWRWRFERHALHFELNGGGDRASGQDTLTVVTNALAVVLYVEQSLYDYFRRHQPNMGKSSYGFEHFAQRHMTKFNQMAAAAIHPEAPNGVLDRMRLERVAIVPDGALPLKPSGSAFNLPNPDDRVADMQWGFPASAISLFQPFAERLGPERGFWGIFDYNGALLHELGHARYLVDVYAYDVFHETNGSTVDVLENGKPVVGSPYLPATAASVNGVPGWLVHRTSELGLMNAQYEYIDRYSAVALNLIAGHRATQGNSNMPRNGGVFMNDLPADNRLTITDSLGVPLAGAEVRVFRSVRAFNPPWSYPRAIDNTPDLILSTDANGSVRLGRNPFTTTGSVGGTATVLLIRVAHAGRVGFAFLEHFHFNLEYWRGRRQLGQYTLPFRMLPAGL